MDTGITKRAVLLLIVVLLLGFPSPHGVFAADSQDQADYSSSGRPEDAINSAISKKGAGWVAGKTSVSELPSEQRKKLTSLRFSATLSEAPRPYQAPQVGAAPAAFDWRSYNGLNYVTPIKDQGSCGSCWAFAPTAALESRILIDGNTPGLNIDLSEQVMVSCDTADEGCLGGWLDKASAFIRDKGLPPEACYPYLDADGVCSNACSACKQESYRVADFQTVSSTVDAIKDAVSSAGPLYCGMNVYDDFLYYKSGVYQHVSGLLDGAHAVAIVGYDDGGQYFIVKNSWGTGWGENGFFRIAYTETASDTLFGEQAYVYGKVVFPGVSFLVNPGGLNFGTLILPDTPSQDLVTTITNNGTAALTNVTFQVTGQAFTVKPTTVASLSPGATFQATVTYRGHAGKTPDTGTLNISSGGVTQNVPLYGVSNTRPARPVNLSPADKSTGVALPCTLSSSAFSDDDKDAHQASQWIIKDAAGNTVYQTNIKQPDGTYSSFDPNNKTSLPVPSGLLADGQQYSWQVTYQDDRVAESLPSAPTSFATPGFATGSSSGSSGGGGGGGGCFIATAVYGSPYEEHVVTLRDFRDRWLITNRAGRGLVRFYYRHSPTLVTLLDGHEGARACTRYSLTLVVYVIRYPYILLFVLSIAMVIFLTRRKRAAR